MSDAPLNVLHVTTTMGEGGAEAMLSRVITHSDNQRIRHHLLALSIEGPLWAPTVQRCASALNLRLEKKWAAIPRLAAVRAFVKQARPDVIQGWMYHGNLVARWLRKSVAKRAPLVFGIRQALYDLSAERTLTRWVIRDGARYARDADIVIYNSEVAREHHRSLGYIGCPDTVIANGFETVKFRPDGEIRRTTRRELGFTDHEFVVGIVARFHPVKDHATFVAAARQLAAAVPNARFVIVGPGCTPGNERLLGLIDNAGMAQRVALLGSWRQMETLYPALDALCLTSLNEGFPNVVGEAMSAGRVCVATNVGDVGKLLGDTGFLVAPRDVAALSGHLERVARLSIVERDALGARARQRIIDNFQIAAAVERHLGIYQSLASQRD